MSGGVLALWKDCAPGREGDFERWYQTEHFAERLAVPGFLTGRRYEAIDAPYDYFCYYEVETPEVLASEPYLARVAEPTPLTTVVMTEVMRNMSRTTCRVERRRGAARGAVAATVELTAPDNPDLPALVDELGRNLGVARVELWKAAEAAQGEPSDEERLRGGDDRIGACLFFETLRERDAKRLLDLALTRLDGAVGKAGAYRLLCELSGAP